MLEQKEFFDEHGTRWLNRPGPPQGPSLLLLGLLIGAPLLICLGGTTNALLLGCGGSFVLLIGALLTTVKTAAIQVSLQTCPKCHYTRKKGYTRCRCGYPER
jgi:hypothetical protein